MRRRSRLLRVAKWGGVVVCASIAATWIGSIWFQGYYPRLIWRFGVGIAKGGVELDYSAYAQRVRTGTWMKHAWLPSIGGSYFDRRSFRMIGSPPVRDYYYGRSAIMPLWMLLVIVAVPTTFIWRLDRHRLPGHCSCGYDLTGNESGVCPECGRRLYGSSSIVS